MDRLSEVAERQKESFRTLRQAARTFDDVQHQRIILANRLSHVAIEDEVGQALALMDDLDDVDGIPPTGHDVFDAFRAVEKEAKRWIRHVYKQAVPENVVKWQEQTAGISDYSLGRLLGEAGHPRLATPFRQVPNPNFDPDRPQSAKNEKRTTIPLEPRLRSMGEWWQRCGHGRPGRIPEGASQEDVLKFGVPRAKMVVHLMMVACWKMDGVPNKNGQDRPLSAYRTVAEETKARYSERTHTGPCTGGSVSTGDKVVFAKCKIDSSGAVMSRLSGSEFDHYADVGDPYSPGHVQAIALRHAGKAMLADLYDAAEEDWCR